MSGLHSHPIWPHVKLSSVKNSQEPEARTSFPLDAGCTVVISSARHFILTPPSPPGGGEHGVKAENRGQTQLSPGYQPDQLSPVSLHAVKVIIICDGSSDRHTSSEALKCFY